MRQPSLLPQKLPLELMQTQWAQLINPVLGSPLLQGALLKEVGLVSGANTVNHLLGRPLQGWMVVRQRAAASLYDTQDSNPRPSLTLTLQASAPTTVDLWVF